MLTSGKTSLRLFLHRRVLDPVGSLSRCLRLNRQSSRSRGISNAKTLSRRNASIQSIASDKLKSVKGTVVRRKTLTSSGVHTLDPSRLLPKDFQDLSEYTAPYISINIRDLCDRFGGPARRPQLFYHWERSGVVPSKFPPGTRGFLYFKAVPGVPLLACGIRFRITRDSDPANFSEGRDLLLPNGHPWSVVAMRTVTFHKYGALRELLIQDGLIPRNMFKNATSALGPGSVGVLHSRSNLIYSLDQEFAMDIQRSTFNFWTMRGDSDIAKGRLNYLFSTTPTGRQRFQPYKGSILVRFERSSLPQHRNTRTLVLRVVKIIDSVEQVATDSDFKWALLKPEEGGLVMRAVIGPHHGSGKFQPWACDVDKTIAKKHFALKLLFDD